MLVQDELFNGAVAAILSFRSYMEHKFDFLRAVYSFYSSSCSNPSLQVLHLFLSQKERYSFFTERFFSHCQEQLFRSDNSFLVTNIFSDQLHLDDNCFFSIATVSEKHFLQNNYSEHVLF